MSNLLHQDLNKHIESAFSQYSTGSYYQDLIKAKDKYFELTGKPDEDDDDYGNKMDLFNEWYLFDYKKEDSIFIESYLDNNFVNEELKESLQNTHFSVFQLKGTTFFGNNIVVYDIIHNKKFVLTKGHPGLPFLKGDLFLARVITVNNNHCLTNTLVSVPSEAKSIIINRAKKIRKKKDPALFNKFVMEITRLRTKYLRYSQTHISKIFIFSDIL